MMRIKFLLFFVLMMPTNLYAQGITTTDPIAQVNNIVDSLENIGSDFVASEISAIIGNSEIKKTLTSFLNSIQKRKPKFKSIAYDHEFGGSVRTIIYYLHGLNEELPFLYIRFVYKQTGSGWQMTHFGFDSETQLPFPPKYGINEIVCTPLR